MRRLSRVIAGIMLVMALFNQFQISADASNKISVGSFDYVRYADTYPDLKAAYGYDAQKLYAHYVNLGKSEGRLGMRTRASYLNAAIFDASRYAAENPDVVAAKGTGKKALFDHYMRCGQYEGRQAWSTDSKTNAKLKAYDVVASVTNGSMSEYERIRAVHDWLVKNVVYNMMAYTTGNYSESDYTAVGPLLMGTGVCSGYSAAFSACLDIMGVENRIAYSPNHAWNEVKLCDGSWVSCDVTWDDPVPDRGYTVSSYEYFLIPREQMAQVMSHNIQGYY